MPDFYTLDADGATVAISEADWQEQVSGGPRAAHILGNDFDAATGIHVLTHFCGCPDPEDETRTIFWCTIVFQADGAMEIVSFLTDDREEVLETHRLIVRKVRQLSHRMFGYGWPERFMPAVAGGLPS